MNQTRLMKRNGVTLLEVVIVGAISAAVMLPTVYFISHAILYFHGTRIHSQLISDANTCQFTIRKLMQLSSAKTLTIDTPPGAPPYSHASFKNGTTVYDVLWDNGTVTLTAGGVLPTILATHVKSLSFVVPDPAMPTQVMITIRLSAPIDTQHTVNAQLTNQLVEMLP